jgi:ribonuclease HII
MVCILNASIKAMQECVLKSMQPEYIVDGNSPFIRKKGIKTVVGKILLQRIEILLSIPSSSIVRSEKFMSIAAASITGKKHIEMIMDRDSRRIPNVQLETKQRLPNEHRAVRMA